MIDRDRLARIRATVANASPPIGTVAPTATVRTVRVADVKPERVKWLWVGRVPRGMITLVDGDPGLGKSTMTLDLAARVSRGRAVMPYDAHDLNRAPADVILMTAEDNIATTIRPAARRCRSGQRACTWSPRWRGRATRSRCRHSRPKTSRGWSP